MTGPRLPLLIFGAVFAAALVLAALGYLSLRRWEQAAERQLREQARDAAQMAAEKVEMAVVRAEQDGVADMHAAALDPAFGPAAVEGWRSRHPLFDAVYLCGRDGRVLYPVRWSAEDGLAIAALRAEISQGFWDRGGRRHLDVNGRVVLATVLQGSPRGPLLVGLRRDERVLGREVLDRALASTEGGSALVVLDASGRSV